MDGYKTMIIALAMLAGAMTLIMTNRAEFLEDYWKICAAVGLPVGLRENAAKGGFIQFSKGPSQPAGVDTKPGG